MLHHYNTPGHAHELTFSCYHKREYLRDSTACNLLLAELQKAREEHQFKLWAYVCMPDHVHALLWPLNTAYSIAKILNDVKGRMVKEYRDYVLSNKPDLFNRFAFVDNSKKRTVFRFWQAGGGFDRNFRDARAIYNSIRYIELNPVKKGLAATPEEYRWSSAWARKRNEGLVPDRFNQPL